MPEKLINVVFQKNRQQDNKTTNSIFQHKDYDCVFLFWTAKREKHTIIIFNINKKEKNLNKYFFLHAPGHYLHSKSKTETAMRVHDFSPSFLSHSSLKHVDGRDTNKCIPPGEELLGFIQICMGLSQDLTTDSSMKYLLTAYRLKPLSKN